MPASDPLPDVNLQRLKALGHGARLSIVRVVVQGPVEGTPAGETQSRLAIPGSTLRHHLSELTRAGILKPAREGTTIRYAACFDNLRALTNYLWEELRKLVPEGTRPSDFIASLIISARKPA